MLKGEKFTNPTRAGARRDAVVVNTNNGEIRNRAAPRAHSTGALDEVTRPDVGDGGAHPHPPRVRARGARVRALSDALDALDEPARDARKARPRLLAGSRRGRRGDERRDERGRKPRIDAVHARAAHAALVRRRDHVHPPGRAPGEPGEGGPRALRRRCVPSGVGVSQMLQTTARTNAEPPRVPASPAPAPRASDPSRPPHDPRRRRRVRFARLPRPRVALPEVRAARATRPAPSSASTHPRQPPERTRRSARGE